MQKSASTFRVVCHTLLMVSMILHSSNVLAWGNLGHRITGLIAEELLTPATHHQVESLLGDETLADAATYMDTHRAELTERWPHASHWHYDNRPVCNSKSYCTDGDCATKQIERFSHIIADIHTPRQDRTLALRLFVHMVGDIHQPLHMADNHDRGGNDAWVRLYAGAERRNLHQVFDTELVRDNLRHQRDYNYARELISKYHSQLSRWQQGTVNAWADESYELGLHDVYQSLPHFACTKHDDEPMRTITLSPAYLQRAHEDVEIQLVKAGARIAALLNSTLH